VIPSPTGVTDLRMSTHILKETADLRRKPGLVGLAGDLEQSVFAMSPILPLDPLANMVLPFRRRPRVVCAARTYAIASLDPVRVGGLMREADFTGLTGLLTCPNLGISEPGAIDFFLTRPVDAKATGDGLISAKGVWTERKSLVGVLILWSIMARCSVIPRRRVGRIGRGRTALIAGVVFRGTCTGAASVLRRACMTGLMKVVGKAGVGLPPEALADRNFEGDTSISPLDSLDMDLANGVVGRSECGTLLSVEAWIPSPMTLPKGESKLFPISPCRPLSFGLPHRLQVIWSFASELVSSVSVMTSSESAANSTV